MAQVYGWPANVTDDEILARLAALNKQRGAEEARGLVRWLRPEYQVPRFGTAKEKAEQIEADLGPAPISAAELVRGFKQGRKAEARVAATLSSLARTGFISAHDSGRRFALRRVA